MREVCDSAIADYMQRSIDVMQRATKDPAFCNAIRATAEAVLTCFSGNGKLLLAGNGGSAADAQHIAAEFLVRFKLERQPLPAIALTTDSSVLTAMGNDYGFDRLFERQVRGLGRRDDVFIGISTSGRSANILSAFAAARDMGLVTIGFTGNSGNLDNRCDLVLAAPSDETALIQQMHIMAAHIICGLVELEVLASNN
jgi:D-sedoheptulose 7-phosphate isomerase